MNTRRSARSRVGRAAARALAAGTVLAAAGLTATAAPALAAPTGGLDGPCVVESATIEWGFKESFRAYVSGSIANGAWEPLDGASYETPLFRFTGGGELDAATGQGELAFAGAVRFTGHDGVLDTLIADPRIVITGPATAELVVDVTGTRQDFEEVEAVDVRFATLELAAATAVERTASGITLSDVPATLTEAGAAAFGTYPAGEPLDPLTLEAALPSGCATALGSAPGPPPAVFVGVSIGIAVAAAVAAVGVVLVRRRAD